MDCCDDSMAMDRIVCPKPRPVGPSNLNSVMPLRFHIRNDAVAFDSKSGNELPDLIHRKITIPFLLPEMVERVGSMLNYFLLQIVGPQRKSLSLKDPEKYEFRPKFLVKQDSGEVLERWNFSIETDSEVVEKGVSREKSDKEIMREIQAIMRQIASSITYLPCLDEPCIFDVLAYTDKDCVAPFTWIESDPKLIANPQMVKLHSFDTKIHKVDTLVSYKNDEWDES
ncbi:hypothetical protein CASFOL_013342 [Castilleja foliolosa]|uniref:HORMA domain-containing protein n=1 Tax=Castilleja foliolosa TaxID=1961234 RepID=A0ABD3DMU0_9LAMI